MKIKSIKSVGKLPVYDISVADAEHYVLENGTVTHNTGMYLSSDNIWIIGRRQDKEGNDIVGYDFVINIEKSRHVREKTKIPINVNHLSGISRWSGLFEIALEGGFIKEAKKGWYTIDGEKNFRKADIETDSTFWKEMVVDEAFVSYVKNKYQVSHGKIMQDE